MKLVDDKLDQYIEMLEDLGRIVSDPYGDMPIVYCVVCEVSSESEEMEHGIDCLLAELIRVLIETKMVEQVERNLV